MTPADPDITAVAVDLVRRRRCAMALAGLSAPQALAVLVSMLAHACMARRDPREAAEDLGRTLARTVDAALAKGAS